MGPKEKPKSKGQKNSELIRLLEDVANLKGKLADTMTQIKEEKQVGYFALAKGAIVLHQAPCCDL